MPTKTKGGFLGSDDGCQGKGWVRCAASKECSWYAGKCTDKSNVQAAKKDDKEQKCDSHKTMSACWTSPIDCKWEDDACIVRSQDGGLRRTKVKIQTPAGTRVVHKGPLGGKYVKVNGKFVSASRYKK